MFDPTETTVQATTDHLATADPDEFARVLEAEKAGRGRQGILTYVQPASAVLEPSEDGYTRRVVSS